MRLNGARIEKPAQSVQPGDTLTFPQGRQVRVVRIKALATRRGPAPEAQALYADLTPEPQPRAGARPTKKDRRDAAFPKDSPA